MSQRHTLRAKGSIWVVFAASAALVAPNQLAADLGFVANGEFASLATYRVPFGGVETDIGIDYPVSGLAISPSGELFGVTTPFPGLDPPRLARVNPVGGTLEIRGVLQVTTGSDIPDFGLAFDGLGRLWLGTTEGRIYRVDPANGAATLTAELGVPLKGLTGCGASLFSLTHPLDAEVPVRLLHIEPDRGTSTALGAGTSLVWANGGAGLDFSSDGRLWGVLWALEAIPSGASSEVELDPVSGELVNYRNIPYESFYNGLALARPLSSCPGRGVVEVPSLAGSGLAMLTVLLAFAALAILRRSRSPSPL